MAWDSCSSSSSVSSSSASPFMSIDLRGCLWAISSDRPWINWINYNSNVPDCDGQQEEERRRRRGCLWICKQGTYRGLSCFNLVVITKTISYSVAITGNGFISLLLRLQLLNYSTTRNFCCTWIELLTESLLLLRFFRVGLVWSKLFNNTRKKKLANEHDWTGTSDAEWKLLRIYRRNPFLSLNPWCPVFWQSSEGRRWRREPRKLYIVAPLRVLIKRVPSDLRSFMSSFRTVRPLWVGWGVVECFRNGTGPLSILLHKNNKQLMKNLHFAFRRNSLGCVLPSSRAQSFLRGFCWWWKVAQIFYFTLNCIPRH